MGLFDDYAGLPPASDQQQQPPPQQPPAAPAAPAYRPGMFDELNAMTPPGSVERLRLPPRRPEEMRASPPESYTEAARSFMRNRFIDMGADPYNANRLADIGSAITGFTPVGPALSLADIQHDVGRGNYGSAALDVIGAAPGARMVRRAAGGLPEMIPALSSPSWVKRLAPELDRGFVTPSTPELIGRGSRYNEPVGTAQQAYDFTRNSPLQYHPATAQDFANRAMARLQTPAGGSFSPTPGSAPGTFAMLSEFGSRPNPTNAPISSARFDDLRQLLRNQEGKEGEAGRRAVDILDAYMVNPPQGAFVGGGPRDLADLTEAFRSARGDYRAGKTAQTVENQIDYAGTRAAAAHSGMNIENTTRQKLANLTSPTSSALDYATQPERNVIREVARTGGLAPREIANSGGVMSPDLPGSNTQRYWGNLLGGGGGVGQAGIAGLAGYVGGHLTGLVDPITAAAATVGLPAAVGYTGRAIKQAGNERAVQAAEGATDFIRRNSPEFGRRLAATQTVTDPNALVRDAITYAMMPTVARQGRDIWDQSFVPYENR